MNYDETYTLRQLLEAYTHHTRERDKWQDVRDQYETIPPTPMHRSNLDRIHRLIELHKSHQVAILAVIDTIDEARRRVKTRL